MHVRSLLSSVLAVVLMATTTVPVSAQAETGRQAQQRKEAELPHCTRSLGAIAIIDPEKNWWSDKGLGSPSAVLKVFVSQSGCFKLVDRGSGMAAAERERTLAAAGVLRRGSNVGKGQVRTADYVLIPDLVSQNENAGGSSIAGIAGTLLGGTAGAILGGIKVSKKTASVTLALTNVRSSEQDAIVEGHAKKNDLGWAAGSGVMGGGGLAAAGAGSYTNTEIGQIIVLAYLDAYIKMVKQLGGLPDNPSAASVQQAITLTRPGRLFTEPSLKSKAIRTLEAGALLYPTGTKSDDGLWWEVQDEIDTKGWVPAASIQLAK